MTNETKNTPPGGMPPSIVDETLVRFSRRWGATVLTVIIQSSDITGEQLRKAAEVVIDEAETEFTEFAANKGFTLPPEDESNN